jgi:hypothetical protein
VKEESPNISFGDSDLDLCEKLMMGWLSLWRGMRKHKQHADWYEGSNCAWFAL